MKDATKAIIISATSDIGTELALYWKKDNIQVAGTYRSKEYNYNLLKDNGIDLCYVDMMDNISIQNAVEYYETKFNNWDILVLCPAVQDPIGKFEKTDFDKWENSVIINFTSQLRILHGLLPFRNTDTIPTVVFFAGGGTNSAPIDYSSYTISKIASIKMVELLDAEMRDVKFIIYGPGWVNTKIHQSTLENKELTESNYERTIHKLNSDECTPMKNIIDAINWGISLDKETISGRNISVVYDKWGTLELEKQLKNDTNMYKLRRSGN